MSSMPKQQNTLPASKGRRPLTPEEEADRRAAMRETLPGFLYGVFTLGLTLAALVWFAISALRGG